MREKDYEQPVEGDPSEPEEDRVFSDRELAKSDADDAAKVPPLVPEVNE